MHQCRDCNESLPSQFYGTAKGGLMHICKRCHKAKMKLNRMTNPRAQEYDRERFHMHADRRAKSALIAKQWRKDHPVAYKAQNAVNNAVRDGRLKKDICAICGTSENVHAHHKNYEHPLDIKWLCAKCHHRLHSAFPELGGHYTEERT